MLGALLGVMYLGAGGLLPVMVAHVALDLAVGLLALARGEALATRALLRSR